MERCPKYFQVCSGSSDYDDPRDYREWCDWSDKEDDEGYCDPFLEEAGDEYASDSCDWVFGEPGNAEGV